MILQALKEYYDRKAADPDSGIAPFGWEWKEIPFVVVIDSDGGILGIDDTREGDGKKKKGKLFLVPQAVKKASGVAANLLWDNSGYVFGVDMKGKPERAEKQKDAFIKRVEDAFTGVEEIVPLLKMLKNGDNDRFSIYSVWQELVESGANISFRYKGDLELVCQKPAVRQIIDRKCCGLNTADTICLITGEKETPAILHTAIKGVWGAQSSGANIVSFNLDSFRSYGKKQGENAPVSEYAAFAYTTALNTLLSKEFGQKIIIGDASTVFWSSKETRFERMFSSIFSEPPKDNPDDGVKAVRELYESINTGAFISNDPDRKFYVLGLSPNAARISIRFWMTGTIAQFAEKIKKHFEDFAIIKPPKEPEHYSVWRVLVNISSQDKSDNIIPNVAGAFFQSILQGTPYPATLLQAALRRIRSDVKERVKPVRAALIKAWLNRYYRIHTPFKNKELTMSLDVSQPSVGYQLGRLFAALEKIQEEANPGLNATIREKYYGAVCGSPVTVFPNLLRLKNHHLPKFTNTGRVVYFERLLGEIIERFSDFPAHLDLHEQGRFAIGYYHQRQDFFTKKETAPAK